MRKVLFFLEGLSGGGAEKVLSDIVCNLDQNKYDLIVCTVTDEGVYQDKITNSVKYESFLKCADFKSGGIKKFSFWLKTKLIYKLPAKIIYRWFIKDKYDIEIAFIEGFATKLIAASSNIYSNKIAWLHTDMESNNYANNMYKNHLEHIKTYQKYKMICCVSNSVKEVFNKMFFDDERVIVQYNPVDSEDVIFKGNESIDLIPNSALQLGTIGRLEHQKGFIRLIKCLGELSSQNFDFSLWIMGEGSQRSEIESLIDKYQLQDKVKLLGFQKNPYKYMNKCDAFICSSYAEGFSTAATEALILGKPIFTTECAGMQELFGDEKCGEIVHNTDDDLYDMLKRLCSGEWKVETYVEAVKRRATEFDIKKRMKEIEKILDA